MRVWAQSRLDQLFHRGRSVGAVGFVVTLLLLSASQSASALPAFARKYGMRCSACHEAWPMLNYFGQKFKDNGYQLMNDRDSPIWQNPSYWPATFRMTPNWHRESSDKVVVTAVDGTTSQQRITSHGFDLSGLDFHTAGTLEKNFSFYLLPSSDSTGAFHFEQVFARLDNLAGSPWLNVKLGKFELDNLVSEKRILTLTNISGVYQTYHFHPPNDSNFYGQIGDNQLGLEYMGHSADDRTRVSAALLSSNDGQVGLPSSNAYTGFFGASRAFDTGKLGVQRVGFYAMVGQAPTYFLNAATPFGNASGQGNKGFSREGFVGLFYVNKLDFLVVTQHGSDSAYFATTPSIPATSSSAGFSSPSWNGYMVETHYVHNPQLVFIQRSEFERISQQGLPGVPSDQGNLNMFTQGFRWYPIMNPRAGFALHGEYSWMRQTKMAPDGSDLNSNSAFIGFDFDF